MAIYLLEKRFWHPFVPLPFKIPFMHILLGMKQQLFLFEGFPFGIQLDKAILQDFHILVKELLVLL